MKLTQSLFLAGVGLPLVYALAIPVAAPAPKAEAGAVKRDTNDPFNYYSTYEGEAKDGKANAVKRDTNDPFNYYSTYEDEIKAAKIDAGKI